MLWWLQMVASRLYDRYCLMGPQSDKPMKVWHWNGGILVFHATGYPNFRGWSGFRTSSSVILARARTWPPGLSAVRHGKARWPLNSPHTCAQTLHAQTLAILLPRLQSLLRFKSQKSQYMALHDWVVATWVPLPHSWQAKLQEVGIQRCILARKVRIESRNSKESFPLRSVWLVRQPRFKWI